MANGKKSVLLYCDLIHTVEKLTDEQAGKLFKHYLSYINDEDPKTKDVIIDLVFEPIKQNLKRDLKKWEGKQEERSLSGRLGNLKRWNEDLYNKYKQAIITLKEAESIAINRKTSLSDNNIANIAVKGTVTGTGNVTDTVKDIKYREAEFKNSLHPFLKIYGSDLLNEFYLYWTEKKPKGRKMLFEMQKTFDVSRRLQRWDKNNFKGKEKNQPKKEKKLASEIIQEKYGIK